jgi:hypothetical protein
VKKVFLPAALCAVLAASAPAAAVPFIEIGDAGDGTATALVSVGSSPLTSILGDLADLIGGDAFDVDLFQILIVDPVGFSASTVNAPGFTVNDPQLFLFDAAGVGVFMNDDDPSGLNGAQSALGPLPGGFLAGLYFLGIGWWDNEPLDSLANYVFDPGAPINALVTATSAEPLAGWDRNVLSRPDLETAYEIGLTGTAPAVPEPGTLMLLSGGVAGFLLTRRALGRPLSKTSAPSSGRPEPSAGGGAQRAGTTHF